MHKRHSVPSHLPLDISGQQPQHPAGFNSDRDGAHFYEDDAAEHDLGQRDGKTKKATKPAPKETGPIITVPR